MPARNVVIVESPAKAKTINKYLGDDYLVLASFGHVRDLPAKDGSVRPDDDFSMLWEMSDKASRPVDAIARAVKGAERVYLATDPDREGEAIAWHVSELLNERKLAGRADVQRITFHEITKSAILQAIREPRVVNQELVEAYLARRALDYLVGFTLSPVLWRKLPGSRSAGRVQSVALRLVCEREAEIEAFRSREYWSIEAEFVTAAGQSFIARLTHLQGRKLDKYALASEADAKAALAILTPLDYAVQAVERKQVRRNPYPPFTTSTLQQEGSRKLGLGAMATMRLAQKLYEGVDIGGETVGLITYMRTDGVTLSNEAIGAARNLITQSWGDAYLPKSPRMYKTAAKNAQEAHEAIRPTDLFRRPEMVAGALQRDELRLYELIWKRTVACQMESAVFDQVTVDIAGSGGQAMFRATGSILVFDGFLKVYQEDRDDAPDDDGEGVRLPPMQERAPLTCRNPKPEQHFTQPPPRYTEASLVKKLEELGIGRPSTYASILQVLQERDYVRLEKKRFIPEDRGRLVTTFLENFFARYVEYGFTADLETRLDDIAGGRIDWKAVLREFWRHFSAAVEDTRDLTITQVIDALDAALGPHFFPAPEPGQPDPRGCPSCSEGRLGLKLSRTGAFVGCSRYPECRYTRPLGVVGGGENPDGLSDGPRDLGDDPVSGLPVWVRRGPYGAYVQLGPVRDAAEPKTGKERKLEKPQRVSLPRNLSPVEITQDIALRLLALPRDIGAHPETGAMIQAGIGRFGPYIKHGATYRSLPPDDDVLAIGMNRAVALLAESGKGGRQLAAVTPARVLGEHPEDGKPISIGQGRFGPYVKHGALYASLPKGQASEEVTLAQAVALLAAKAAKAGAGKAGGKVGKSGSKAGKSPRAAKSAEKAVAAAEKPARAPRATKASSAKGHTEEASAKVHAESDGVSAPASPKPRAPAKTKAAAAAAETAAPPKVRKSPRKPAAGS